MMTNREVFRRLVQIHASMAERAGAESTDEAFMLWVEREISFLIREMDWEDEAEAEKRLP